MSIYTAEMLPTVFPQAQWGQSVVTFLPLESPETPSQEPDAALVFVKQQGCYVVADIVGRGWCVPSGRREVGEHLEETARREAYEEAGLILSELFEIGTTLLLNTQSGRLNVVMNYVARALEFHPIPDGSESQGVRTLHRSELPEHYFRWDPFLEALFDYVEAQHSTIYANEVEPISKN